MEWEERQAARKARDAEMEGEPFYKEVRASFFARLRVFCVASSCLRRLATPCVQASCKVAVWDVGLFNLKGGV